MADRPYSRRDVVGARALMAAASTAPASAATDAPSTEAGDGVERVMSERQVVAYDIQRRSIAECSGLIPLSHYAEGSKVPARPTAKSIPVRISKDVVFRDHRSR